VPLPQLDWEAGVDFHEICAKLIGVSTVWHSGTTDHNSSISFPAFSLARL